MVFRISCCHSSDNRRIRTAAILNGGALCSLTVTSSHVAIFSSSHLDSKMTLNSATPWQIVIVSDILRTGGHQARTPICLPAGQGCCSYVRVSADVNGHHSVHSVSCLNGGCAGTTGHADLYREHLVSSLIFSCPFHSYLPYTPSGICFGKISREVILLH